MKEGILLLKYFSSTLFTSFNSISGFASAILASFVAFFSPIFPLGFTAIFLIFVDTLTGMLASKKRQEPIVSRKFSRSIYKLLLYSIFLLILYSLEVVLFASIFPIAKIGFGIILMTELFSVCENLDTIFDTKTFKGIFDIIKSLFKKINKG